VTRDKNFPDAKSQESGSWKKNLGSWGTCAAASGAALAMSTNASGDIIYSGLSLNTATLLHESNVNTHASFESSLGNSALAAFVVSNRANVGGGRVGAALLLGLESPLLFGTVGSFAKLYTAGQPILGLGVLGLGGNRAAVLREHNVAHGTQGAWGPGTVTGFVGFKSTATGDLGWIRVTVFDRNSDKYPDEVEIIDSAYNNTPGGAINAGQTTSTTPEPGTTALCLLGLGAAGLLALRRRRAN